MSWAERMQRAQSHKDKGPITPTGDRDAADENQPDGSTVRKALPPIEELPPAPVNPYRGMEQHGVPYLDTREQRVAEMLSADTIEPPEWRPPHADIEPIPVVVKTISTDEFRAFRTMQFPVTGNVNQLIGRDRMRRKVTITNAGPSAVVIGPDVGLTAKNGYPILSGQSFAMEHTEPVYVTSMDGATAVSLGVLTEYLINPMDQNIGYAHGG